MNPQKNKGDKAEREAADVLSLETKYKVATGNNNLEKRALQGGQVRGIKE